MRCDEFKDRLDAYIDAELPPQEMRAVDVHLKTCELCAAEVRLQDRLKREVRMAGKAYAPSLDFRRRVEAAIAPQKKANRFSLWVPSLAMAAVLLIAALFGWNQFRSRSDAALAELVDMHVATLASASPVDVVSTDRHTVKPWFQGKLPFTFNLPEFKDTGFTLLGGGRSHKLHTATTGGAAAVSSEAAQDIRFHSTRAGFRDYQGGDAERVHGAELEECGASVLAGDGCESAGCGGAGEVVEGGVVIHGSSAPLRRVGKGMGQSGAPEFQEGSLAPLGM